VRLGRSAPKSQSASIAPRVDNSSDRGHSSSMSLVCGGVWSINRVCLLATLPTCHSPTPMRTKAMGGGPVGGPSENLLDYHDAPCVVARGQHTPSSEPAMQKRLTSLWSVDFFCALVESTLGFPPKGVASNQNGPCLHDSSSSQPAAAISVALSIDRTTSSQRTTKHLSASSRAFALFRRTSLPNDAPHVAAKHPAVELTVAMGVTTP
jgi:hypothetical protein